MVTVMQIITNKSSFLFFSSELRVKVYHCDGLPMKFVGGTVYTYVEVEMFPFHRMTSEKPRTKYIRNEFSPVFNDEVCITINKEEVDDQKMYLHVCDYNQISTRDLIGSCKIELDDVSFKAKGKETVYEETLRWIDSVSNSGTWPLMETHESKAWADFLKHVNQVVLKTFAKERHLKLVARFLEHNFFFNFWST